MKEYILLYLAMPDYQKGKIYKIWDDNYTKSSKTKI